MSAACVVTSAGVAAGVMRLRAAMRPALDVLGLRRVVGDGVTRGASARGAAIGDRARLRVARAEVGDVGRTRERRAGARHARQDPEPDLTELAVEDVRAMTLAMHPRVDD